MIALDAFTSDAIPVHLLTKEAFAVYREHLQSDGVLAVHISNRHVDLEPLIRGQAREIGWTAVLIENDEQKDNEVYSARWVIVTANDDDSGERTFLRVGRECFRRGRIRSLDGRLHQLIGGFELENSRGFSSGMKDRDSFVIIEV